MGTSESNEFPWDYSSFKWHDIPREVRSKMVLDASQCRRTWIASRNSLLADVCKCEAGRLYNTNWDGCRLA
jgi:hypothetical protein